MKKLFTLIAAALMTVGAWAEATTVTWDKTLVLGQSSNDTTLVAGGISLEVVNNAGGTSDYVGTGTDFLHWNGTSKATCRYAKFTAPKDGIITINYKSNNATATDRVVACGTTVLTGTDPTEMLKNSFIYAAGYTNGSEVKTISGTVKANDVVYIYNANGGCGICSIVYIYEGGSSPEPTPTSSDIISYNHAAAVTSGVALSGTTAMANVKIHTNTDAVDCIQLKNGYTTENVLNTNYIELSYEGGFKTGDVVTIAGFFNNSDETKTSAADLFVKDSSEKGYTVLFTTDQFVNGRLVDTDPVAQTYTLEADAEKLYIGRNGNTGTNIYTLKVSRGSATIISSVAAAPAKANKVIKTANYIIKDGKKYNYAGQQMK